MFKGFKEFITRGNVVQLAVAVVMGAAFGAVITSLASDVIMPLITAIFGKQDYNRLLFTVNHSQIFYGRFITALISFLLIALGVYFLIVAPLNRLEATRKRHQGVPNLPAPVESELELLAQIRDELRNGNGPAPRVGAQFDRD